MGRGKLRGIQWQGGVANAAALPTVQLQPAASIWNAQVGTSSGNAPSSPQIQTTPSLPNWTAFHWLKGTDL